ncbi:hypothetical protein [Streptomyces sp. NRRL S-37]|uniref:hypothetical protein n=1 Tax=Streptomyces sp. NRRL S-37 TaxID=1463903 RepID=UPI00099C2296|nr:hypothetical protein [Streptomyces sp. NRRL S-37]
MPPPGRRGTPPSAPLPAGSLLALCTDGLVETPGSDLTRSIDDPADDPVRHAVPRHAYTDDIALLLWRSP